MSFVKRRAIERATINHKSLKPMYSLNLGTFSRNFMTNGAMAISSVGVIGVIYLIVYQHSGALAKDHGRREEYAKMVESFRNQNNNENTETTE
mmetsp:Transcript_42963/g.52807  ORF Transcript_42963/g.52807 Transcript_42963/m.52807 type:complete len:93 (+) Transcript_42963:23-301(+)